MSKPPGKHRKDPHKEIGPGEAAGVSGGFTEPDGTNFPVMPEYPPPSIEPPEPIGPGAIR